MTLITQNLVEARQALVADDQAESLEFPLASVTIGTKAVPDAPSEVTMQIEGRTLPLTEHAQKDLASYLGIPAPFFLKLPADIQATLVIFFQHQVTDRTRRRAVVASDTIHGITSPKFFPVRNAPLLDNLVELVGGGDEDHVRLTFFEHSFPHTRISISNTSEGVHHLRNGGQRDEIEVGVGLINSLVKWHKLEVQPFLYCLSNEGRILAPAMAGEEPLYRFKSTDDDGDPYDWLEAAADASAKQSHAILKACDETNDSPMPDPQAALEAQLTHIPGYLRDFVQEAFANDSNNTLWGLVSALTKAVAEPDAAGPLHRIQVERHCGLLVVNRSCDECRRPFVEHATAAP